MIVKPFLKFPGGKGYLADTIISLFPKKFGCYYEPMVGGGAILFEMISRGMIKKAVIGDVNKWLTATYADLQENPKAIIAQLSILRKKHREYVEKYDTAKKLYYKVRKYANRQERPDAACTIYLSKTCFNGLFRFNKKGYFNAPFGKQENPSLFDKENLLNVSKALNSVKIINCSYQECVKSAKKHDLVYFDPPYWPVSESSFTAYSQHSFSPDDHAALARVARGLRDRGVYVALSNAHVPEVKKLYKDFNQHTVQAPRRINRDGANRGNVKELVITSF